MEGCIGCKGYERQERRERLSPWPWDHGGDTGVERAGVPRIRLHDPRQTHDTLLLRAGTPIRAVSERLRHAKTSVTLVTYAHVLPDMQD